MGGCPAAGGSRSPRKESRGPSVPGGMRSGSAGARCGGPGGRGGAAGGTGPRGFALLCCGSRRAPRPGRLRERAAPGRDSPSLSQGLIRSWEASLRPRPEPVVGPGAARGILGLSGAKDVPAEPAPGEPAAWPRPLRATGEHVVLRQPCWPGPWHGPVPPNPTVSLPCPVGVGRVGLGLEGCGDGM